MRVKRLKDNTRLWVRRLPLLCGVLGPPLVLVFLFGAGLATPGYSHVSHAISQLGASVNPHPEVMNTGLGVYGLLVICFAYGLYRLLRRGGSARAICILMAVSGACTIGAAVFHVDPMGAATSTEGSVHAVLAQVAFGAFLLAALAFAWYARGSKRWRGFAGLSGGVVLLALVLAFLFWAKVFPGAEGALQRSFGAVAMLWVGAVSARSLRLHSALARS